MQEHSQTFVLLSKAPSRQSGLGSTWNSEDLGTLGGTGEQVSASEGWAGILVAVRIYREVR